MARPVNFLARFTASSQFHKVFREGMALVEEAANYLDGDGPERGAQARPPHSLAYATESMRLTTRLMQLASWLLIRRAVSEGELTAGAGDRGAAQDQASGEGGEQPTPRAGSDSCRPPLQELIAQSCQAPFPDRAGSTRLIAREAQRAARASRSPLEHAASRRLQRGLRH